MEAIKVIGGGIIAFGTITIRWVYYGRERQAWRLAQARGVTMLRVVPPYNRLGVSVRCEVWTLLGAFLGGLIGFSIGWAYLGSVGLGAVLGSVGAALFGWRYRAVTSIIVACEHEEQRPPPPRLNVTGSRLRWAVTGAACGLIVGATAGPTFHQHGTTLIVETGLACAYLSWRFVKLRDDREPGR